MGKVDADAGCRSVKEGHQEPIEAGSSPDQPFVTGLSPNRPKRL